MRNKYLDERSRCPFVVFGQKSNANLLQMKYNFYLCKT